MKLSQLQERTLSSLHASSSTSTHSILPNKTPRLPKTCRFTPQTAASNNPDATSIAASIKRIFSPSSKNPKATGGVAERYKEFLNQWDKGFMDAVQHPDGVFLETIYGQIPPQLQGTLFRNGPGKFTMNTTSGTQIAHPYDGDGFVASIAFNGKGKAFYRSRLVETPELKAEEAAQQVLFRGTFATQRSGGPAANIGDLYVKNTSNTNVVEFGGRLWTLFEAGQPYRLDPTTLKTIGLELLDGTFKRGLPFDLGSEKNNSMFATMTRFSQTPEATAALSDEMLSAGGDAVTAHPHICPITQRLVTFTYQVRPTLPSSPSSPPLATDLTFYEINKSTMKPVKETKYSLPGFAFLHDFALTENYYVIFQNPVTVDNAPYIAGLAPAASCVRWVPNQPTKLHLIPRNPNYQPKVFSAPPLFVFHHANAFEDGDKIIVDSIHYDSLPAVGREALASQVVDPDAAFTSRLRRVEIDLKTQILKVRCAFDRYLEMPAINPDFVSQKHKFVYGYHSIFEDPQIALAKVDVEGRRVDVWKPGKNRFCLEPKFIPRSPNSSTREEDDGWLITQLLDSQEMRSEIVILDAQNLENGPVAVIALPEPLPSGLHSCWSEVYYGCSSDKEEEVEEEEERVNVVPFSSGGDVNNRLRGSGERQQPSMPSARTKNNN